MFVYKYNDFTKKYYKYDSDDVDLFEPMFDEELHDNDMTPLVKHPTTCMYCNTKFSSRNQLFHHLGYMNIDIRCAKSTTCDTDEYNMDMGEFGFEPKPKKRYKIVKSVTPRKHSKATQLLIAELINDLKL
jgi:hypothetical protein